MVKETWIILLVVGLLFPCVRNLAAQEKRDKRGQADVLRDAEQERDWYKFQALLFKAFLGCPQTEEELEQFVALRKRFEKGTLGGKNKDEIARMLKNGLNKDLGWDSEGKKPRTTYSALLARLEKELNTSKQNADKELAKVLAERAAAKEKLNAVKVELAKKVGEDLKALKDKDKLIDDLRIELRLQTEKPTRQPETPFVDSPSGRIVRLDRTGKTVFIDLGSDAKVQPGLTFSVRSFGGKGKPTTDRKGSVEVVRVIGPHLSMTRIVEGADAVQNGDLLFNPAAPVHVALAGKSWQFKAVSIGTDEKAATQKLNALGGEGWELVGPLGNGLVAFRRPALSAQQQPQRRHSR